MLAPCNVGGRPRAGAGQGSADARPPWIASAPRLLPTWLPKFLYACVRRTVEQDLPRKIDYLRRHDEALRRITDAVEMPDRVARIW